MLWWGSREAPLHTLLGGTSGQQKAECRRLLLHGIGRPLPWAMVFPTSRMSLMGDNVLILLEMTDGNFYIV